VLYSLRRTHFFDGDCWLVSVLDITDRKAEEERLRESEALIALTLSAAALGRWDWNLATGMISGDPVAASERHRIRPHAHRPGRTHGPALDRTAGHQRHSQHQCRAAAPH
jgi:hypothetical protein